MEPIRGLGRRRDVTASLPTHASRLGGPSPTPRPARPARPGGADRASGGRSITGPVPIVTASAALPTPSFETFYEAERLPLGRALAFALGDADLAADAVDEAFTRAYERWPSVSQGNPAAWVYRVAMNWSLSILRRRRRGHHRFYDPAPHAEVVVEPAVHAALAELDPKHRSVVVCRHLLGWSVAETADALHLREGTVKSRLSRANAILQARLAHLRPTEEHP